MKKRLNAGTHWKFHLVRARPSQRIFARLGVLSSRSFTGASHPHSDSFRAIIAWLKVCPYVEQLLRLQVLTVPFQGLPASPIDVYLRYHRRFYGPKKSESAGRRMMQLRLQRRRCWQRKRKNFHLQLLCLISLRASHP